MAILMNENAVTQRRAVSSRRTVMGRSMGARVLLALLAVAGLALTQDDDGGPPKLKRGRPDAQRQTTRTSETTLEKVETPQPAPASPATPDPAATEKVSEQAAPPPQDSGDPFLDKARRVAAAFTDGLPNFLCQEIMARYVSTTRPVSWRALDTLSIDLVYEDHKENYKNIKINGKPTGKSLEESGGAWSTGDFGTLQAALFDEGTEADFHAAGNARLDGRDAIRYDLSVAQDRSGWTLAADNQRITVGYKGSVFLERETARVLRIEIEAARIPASYPFDTAEWTIDYGYTRIGGTEYLVPTRSETLNCSRGTRACSRNVIDFRNYRRFAGESNITFE